MLLPTLQRAHVGTDLHPKAEDKVWVGEEVGNICNFYPFQKKMSRQEHQVEFLDLFLEHGFVPQPLKEHVLYTTQM